MANSQLLGILLIAMVAGVILFRLYSVLGRRTGHEREPQERFRRLAGGTPAKAADTVVALPDRSAQRTETPPPGDPVAQGLLDIKLADRAFNTDHFLTGAQHAYETILSAFAACDRATLRPLLNDEVYTAFDGVMRGREERKEKVAYAFVGFKSAKIVHAGVKARNGEITVEYSAQFISSTSDAAGNVIEGDAKAVRDVVDVWSFVRPLRASDPNWLLVATSGAA